LPGCLAQGCDLGEALLKFLEVVKAHWEAMTETDRPILRAFRDNSSLAACPVGKYPAATTGNCTGTIPIRSVQSD